MDRSRALPIALCLFALTASPAKAKDAPAPRMIGFEGVAMTLDEMNDYFRGKTCVTGFGRRVTFGADGAYRSVYPDSTSEGVYTFAPGVVTVRYTGGSSRYKIGRTERFRAARLTETGQHLLGFDTMHCGAEAK
jgi:hypothetical protein